MVPVSLDSAQRQRQLMRGANATLSVACISLAASILPDLECSYAGGLRWVTVTAALVCAPSAVFRHFYAGSMSQVLIRLEPLARYHGETGLDSQKHQLAAVPATLPSAKVLSPPIMGQHLPAGRLPSHPNVTSPPGAQGRP